MKQKGGVSAIMILSIVGALFLIGGASVLFLKTRMSSEHAVPDQTQTAPVATTTSPQAGHPTFTEPTKEELKAFRRLAGENLLRFYGYYAELGSRAASEKDCQSQAGRENRDQNLVARLKHHSGNGGLYLCGA